jgi:outer membrane receptor protein involved in Fe transport
VRVRATGERDDLDFTDPTEWQGQRVTLPAHATADLDVEYALPLLRGGALRVGVRNLWDERYAEIHNFPQPGRVLGIGLRWGASLRDQP